MNIIPKHIAVIMDGNGRWAERKMLPRVAGHHRGVESARAVVQHCVNQNIQVLTLFAFSSENWQRPPTEVKLLMTLLQKLLIDEVHQLHSSNVKLVVIGDRERLVSNLQNAIVHAEELTQHNSGLQLNIALNYGGRWDIVQATRAISTAVAAGEFSPDEITDSLFSKYLMLSDVPEPDLLIRTSGEQRISNFFAVAISLYRNLFYSNLVARFWR